jgi:hypothetical protein
LNVWSGKPRLYAARPWHKKLMTPGKNHLLNKLSEVLIRVIKGLECSINSAHDAHSPEHPAGNYPDYLSGLVIMTHMHDGFECSSTRDYIYTKS